MALRAEAASFTTGAVNTLGHFSPGGGGGLSGCEKSHLFQCPWSESFKFFDTYRHIGIVGLGGGSPIDVLPQRVPLDQFEPVDFQGSPPGGCIAAGGVFGVNDIAGDDIGGGGHGVSPFFEVSIPIARAAGREANSAMEMEEEEMKYLAKCQSPFEQLKKRQPQQTNMKLRAVSVLLHLKQAL